MPLGPSSEEKVTESGLDNVDHSCAGVDVRNDLALALRVVGAVLKYEDARLLQTSKLGFSKLLGLPLHSARYF